MSATRFRKDRVIGLPQPAGDALDAYLEQRRSAGPGDPIFVITASRRISKPGYGPSSSFLRLNEGLVRGCVDRVRRRCNPSLPVHELIRPHR